MIAMKEDNDDSKKKQHEFGLKWSAHLLNEWNDFK